MMIDTTNHNRIADQWTERELAKVANQGPPIVTVGHNRPPGPLDSAKDALAELNGFLTEMPSVQTPQDAKQAAAFIERTRIALASMEDERKTKVGPLNEQLKKINEFYRAVREPLEKVFAELKRRYNAWDAEEKRKRDAVEAEAAAERLRAAAAARQAAQAADEAIAEAEQGVCVDAGSAIANAHALARAAGKAERAAAVAKRDSKVRVASIMGNKAIAARERPVPSVANIDDACKVIRAIGLTPEIEAVLCTAARKYERAFDEWPPGITVTIERGV